MTSDFSPLPVIFLLFPVKGPSLEKNARQVMHPMMDMIACRRDPAEWYEKMTVHQSVFPYDAP